MSGANDPYYYNNRDDDDDSAERRQRAQIISAYNDLDARTPYSLYTNVVCLKIDEILGRQPLESHKFDELDGDGMRRCTNCVCYQNHLTYVNNNDKTWTCNNCGKQTRFNKQLSKVEKHDIEYKLQPPVSSSPSVAPSPPNQSNSYKLVNTNPSQSNNLRSRLIVFCIDTSGSMYQTLHDPLTDKRKKKLEIVQESCIKAVDELVVNEPNSKVVITLFNDYCYAYEYQRDASNNLILTLVDTNEMITRDEFERDKYDINQFKTYVDRIPPIRECQNLVKRTLSQLKVSGGTSISDALTYSTVLASTLPNSTIVVCTDGTTDEIESGIMVRTNRFFKKIIDHAIKNKTRIYTLQLDESELGPFEEISKKTGGKVGELNDLTATDFNWIIDETETVKPAPAPKPAPVVEDDPNIGDLIIISNENSVSLTPIETKLVDRNSRRDVILIKNFDRRQTRELNVQIDLNDQKQQQRRYEPDRIYFLQIQFKTRRSHRIITTALDFRNLIQEKPRTPSPAPQPRYQPRPQPQPVVEEKRPYQPAYYERPRPVQQPITMRPRWIPPGIIRRENLGRGAIVPSTRSRSYEPVVQTYDRDEKILIKTLIDLQTSDSKPVTKVYRQTRYGGLQELKSSDIYKSTGDSNVHSVDLVEPIKLRNDLFLYKQT